MKKSIISKPNTSYNLYGKQCIYTSTFWTFPKCKEYMRNWHFYKLNNLSRQYEGIYLCKPHHIWLLHYFLVMIPPLFISHISDVSPCNLEVPDNFIADLSILELSRSPERRPSQFTRRINMNVIQSPRFKLNSCSITDFMNISLGNWGTSKIKIFSMRQTPIYLEHWVRFWNI